MESIGIQPYIKHNLHKILISQPVEQLQYLILAYATNAVLLVNSALFQRDLQLQPAILADNTPLRAQSAQISGDLRFNVQLRVIRADSAHEKRVQAAERGDSEESVLPFLGLFHEGVADRSVVQQKSEEFVL